MTHIRVLRVITRLNVGGPAIHVALLSTRLDPERFETLLVAGREGPGEGSMLELGRVSATDLRLVRLPSLGRPISPVDDLRAFASLLALARAFRPHVVHTHLSKAGVVGRIAGRLVRAPVVLHTYHGSVLRGYFGRRENALYLAIERALAALSTRVIAISPRQRDDLVALGVARPERIAVVPLGLDLAPFRVPIDGAAARRALGLSLGAPVVGLVARLVPIKDVGTFVRAVAALRQRLPDVHAVVVGDGEEHGRLEALASELGIADRCRFLGWRADVPALLAAVDVVALSSLNEGSPVSVIEAMAARKPVVATAVGGVSDVVRDGETGLLVPPREPAVFADALERLLTDPDRRERMGGAAVERAQRYDVSRLMRDVEGLYASLLRSSL